MMIRAKYGHSIPANLGIEQTKPQEFLFHGTAIKHMKSIRNKGIVSGKRNYVHLSSDRLSAVKVGKRHGKPIVLTVKTGNMYNEGFKFYCIDNGIWLTEIIPVKFIKI